jgi:hypothetical protein
MQCELKPVELYESGSRIKQCFRCQQYGHISTQCNNNVMCSFCGGSHSTNDCMEKEHTDNRKCAACNAGSHVSWSNQCSARIKERTKANKVYLMKRLLFPVPPPTNSRGNAGESQACGSMTEAEWQVVTKKRKTGVNKVGRPRKIDIQDTMASQNISALFSQANSTQPTGESQAMQNAAEQAT